MDYLEKYHKVFARYEKRFDAMQKKDRWIHTPAYVLADWATAEWMRKFGYTPDGKKQ